MFNRLKQKLLLQFEISERRKTVHCSLTEFTNQLMARHGVRICYTSHGCIADTVSMKDYLKMAFTQIY